MAGPMTVFPSLKCDDIVDSWRLVHDGCVPSRVSLSVEPNFVRGESVSGYWVDLYTIDLPKHAGCVDAFDLGHRNHAVNLVWKVPRGQSTASNAMVFFPEIIGDLYVPYRIALDRGGHCHDTITGKAAIVVEDIDAVKIVTNVLARCDSAIQVAIVRGLKPLRDFRAEVLARNQF